ncbi:hypothetical protein [Marinobacterium jannaschii]|uniref:hypothetical protein n=1 Tax=Marinobacterium jannaschii TaxID=64970 RepID=UPI0004855D8B|nr:hypothetical protein [Marinobacterium jannaschii]
MSFNKSKIAAGLLCCIPYYAVADEASVNLGEVLSKVPDSTLERSKQIKKLEHASKFAELHYSILQTAHNTWLMQQERQKILNESEKKNKGSASSSSEKINVQEMIEQALSSSERRQASTVPKKEGSTPAEPAESLPKKQPATRVKLQSLWGSPNDLVANVTINSKLLELKSGSVVQGWLVEEVSEQGIVLTREGKQKHLYYGGAL